MGELILAYFPGYHPGSLVSFYTSLKKRMAFKMSTRFKNYTIKKFIFYPEFLAQLLPMIC